MSKIGNLLPQVTEFFTNKSQTTSERAAGSRQNFGNAETSIGNLSQTIQTYRNAKVNATVKSATDDEKITVVMNGQTPEAHAEAILRHYGFSKADEKAFQEKFGYDLRKNLTATYRRNDIKSAHKSLGNNRYQVQIPLPKSLLAQIEAVKPQKQTPKVSLPPTTAAASPKPIPQPLPMPISPTQKVGKDVSQMGMAEKLEIVINKAIEHLGPEAGEKLKQLLTPENMAIMVGTTAALIAVQGVPFLDVAVDAVVLGIAAYSLGSEALSAIGDLADFASKTFNAKTEADLDAAGKSLAKATATVGVDALAALLIHKGVKSIKATEIPPPQTKVVEMVTPEGVRVKVRVPVEAEKANVLESRSSKVGENGRRDVNIQEQSGGHTIERHVGKSESWLRNRIENENIDFASSFRNEQIANRAQGRFVNRFRNEVNDWLKSKNPENFVKQFDMNEPVGIIVENGKSGHTVTSRVTVVLAKDNSPQGWHFVTSYPSK